MNLTAKNVKITASGDASLWGGSFCENGLFILLEVGGNIDASAAAHGKEILDILLTKITNFKKRNLHVLQELTDAAKEMKSIETLTLGFLHGDILYLSNLGIGEVFLQRNGKSGKILSSGGISSGIVMQNDALLFTSKTFANCISEEKVQSFLQTESLIEAGEEAYSALVSNPNSTGAAALLVKLENKEMTKESELSPLPVPRKNYKNIIAQKLEDIISRFRQMQVGLWEDDENAKPKKTLLTIAVILIMLLITSIFLNINHSQFTNKQNHFKETLDLVTHQYDEAVSLIDLNPSRARSLLSDGKLSLLAILKEFPKNSNEFKQINNWLGKIAEKEVAAYKIFKFTSVPLFFDINLIKNGGIGTKMALYQKTAVILDSKNKAIYSLLLDTKQAGIIAGNEVVKDTRTIAVHGKFAYLINSDGIVQINISTKTIQAVVKPDKEWGEITELVAFGGNLYLLDRKNNAVWKYILQDVGFSSRVSYLNPDVRVSFASSGKMIVDGSVWVVTDQGTILKFTSGHGDTFTFKGLADTIFITTIFTADEDKSLYVLDKHSQRILVFDKDGNYQSQYQWEELKNADDIAASEEEKKIFVLSQNKIYAIDMK